MTISQLINQFKDSMTIEQLCKQYQCSNLAALVEEMNNCLETDEVTEQNYRDHLEKFIRSYQAWVDSYREDYN